VQKKESGRPSTGQGDARQVTRHPSLSLSLSLSLSISIYISHVLSLSLSLSLSISIYISHVLSLSFSLSLSLSLTHTHTHKEGRCEATWKREFQLPWREAGPPNHLDDETDSDQ
jgi:hypothetical protein